MVVPLMYTRTHAHTYTHVHTCTHTRTCTHTSSHAPAGEPRPEVQGGVVMTGIAAGRVGARLREGGTGGSRASVTRGRGRD